MADEKDGKEKYIGFNENFEKNSGQNGGGEEGQQEAQLVGEK